MDKHSASLGPSSTTAPSATSTSALAEVRFTLPTLPGTHLVQLGPSTVIDADELLAAMAKHIHVAFVREGLTDGD